MYTVNNKIGWLLVCSTNEIKNRPLAFTIAQSKVVIFKNSYNQFSILKDKCIHRHTALSNGEIKDGCIVCPYHGASFDVNGKCTKVPSISKDGNLPRKKILSYKHHIDKYGYLWVNLANDDRPFPNYYLYTQENASVLTFNYKIKSPALAIIENFVDTAHTGIVHKGLFRGQSQKKVEVIVKSNSESVHIETLGESSSQSVFSKILNPQKKPVQHIDEYIAPYNVKVTYQIGKLKITTVSVVTPISEFNSSVHTFISIKGHLLKSIIKPFLKTYTQKILNQDVVILEDQSEQIKYFNNPNSVFFETDKAISEVIRLYQHHLNKNDQAFSGREFTFNMEL